jgi:quercetin dioxygenase-like cupin family protein
MPQPLLPAIVGVLEQSPNERKEAVMGSQHAAGKPQLQIQHEAYWLGPGEGDARWVLGELDTIKATGAQTGGLFGLKESKAAKGNGPPLHVHEHEDEACYVLEGEVTFFVGDGVISAPPARGSICRDASRILYGLTRAKRERFG